MNTIHSKPKMATQHNNSDPCTLLIQTVPIQLYDVLLNGENIKQELNGCGLFLCQQWPLHTIEEEHPKQSPDIISIVAPAKIILEVVCKII